MTITRDVMFRLDNTEGYDAAELAVLNAELADRLSGLEPGTDEYYQTAKAFSDEVAASQPSRA